MTDIAGDPQSPPSGSPPSPWLSVWFSPGDTIVRVLAARPRLFPTLALLSAASVAASFLNLQIGDKLTIPLLDWRFLAVGAAVALILGIVSLYLNAFFLTWSGRLLGGLASFSEMRAVTAWSLAPLCVLLVVYFAVLAGSGGTLNSTTSGLLYAIGLAMSFWAMVMTLVMLKRAQAFGWWRAIFSFALSMALPLLIAVSIRVFLFQPYNMPSGSMKPTLIVGDDFFVSKYAYGYSRFSLPFSPPLFTGLAGRLFGAEPQRGDIVVFRLPRDPATDYIKRVVGLPGDRIQMQGGVLHINGTPVAREHVEDFIDDENRGERVRRFRETLPNGVSYETLDIEDNGALDNTEEYVVPAGHYFMLGDNRDNSTDSRVPSAVGYVPFENLVGRAELIYFSFNRAKDEQPTLRRERLGRLVR
jgi:signal peptidase I